MHVERELRDAAQGLDNRDTKRQVGHKVPIHHIDMDEIGAAVLDPPNLIREVCEVGREHRRGNQHVQRVTSSTTAPPSAIVAPGLRRLVDDHSRRQPRVAGFGTYRHTQTVAPENVDDASGWGADDVGHDVGLVALALVDEQ
jgi:hypothetical protein